jgi:hypothetical protein
MYNIMTDDNSGFWLVLGFRKHTLGADKRRVLDLVAQKIQRFPFPPTSDDELF